MPANPLDMGPISTKYKIAQKKRNKRKIILFHYKPQTIFVSCSKTLPLEVITN